MAYWTSRRISNALSALALGASCLVASACGSSSSGAGSGTDDGSGNDDGDDPGSGSSGGRGNSGSDEPDGPSNGGPVTGVGTDGPDIGGGSGGSGESEPSAGCDTQPVLSSGSHSIEVDGETRTFIIDLPDDYDESTPYPLLFGFHGRGFSAAEFRSASYGNLLSVAGGEAIVVHPDALGEPERAWDTEEGSDDVRFFDALLEDVTDDLCVDEARVFAAGHSSGAYFINTLGCERGDRLRAIAPVAGGGPFGSGGDGPDCTGSVSAWIAHAEDDDTVLFRNGENSRDHWLESNACDEDRFDDVSPSPCVAYEGCDSGSAVAWCAYDGGHDWPSFGARGIWSFFQRF